jgi:lactosylceramide 4-alpha-galactosyltransferase
MRTKYWYTNQSNVLRALLLYTQGGIYMDTDILVTKPLDKLRNVIGMEFIDKVNGAVLKFDQYNPFMADVLNNVFENFDPNIWGNNGPAAVTRTLFGTPKYSNCAHGNSTVPCDDVVTVLPQTAFYPLYWRDIEYTCFLDTSSNHTKRIASIQASSYMVHTNNKASRKYWNTHRHTQPNTLCRWLYNSFCVLCGTTPL